jgi:MFS family permease
MKKTKSNQCLDKHIIASCLVTAGTRVFYTASTALIAEVAGHDERDRWYGLVGATQWMGQATGGLLAGFIVALGGTSSYRVLILANVLSFLLTAITLSWHKTSPASHPQLTTAEPVGYRVVFADRPFLVLVVCNVVFALVLLVQSTGSPLYMIEALKTSTVVIGALGVFGTLLMICTQTLTIRLLESYRRTRSLAVASLIRAVGCALLASALLLPRFLLVPYLFGIVAVNTLSGLIMSPVTTALAAASSPPHLQGRYMAVYQFSWGIAAAIAPTVFTSLYALGPSWPWIALTGPLLAAGLIMILIESRLPPHAVHVHQ